IRTNLLQSKCQLGPIAAIAIVFEMLSSLTLLPAILFAFDKVVFWPKRVHYEPGLGTCEQDIPTKGIWPKVARSVQHRPRVIWLVTAVVLLAGAVGVTQLKAEGVAQSELVLGASEARDGHQALGKHFPGGSGSP